MLCVVICTRERPKMLRRLLESCIELTPDKRSEISFIVLENGPVLTAEPVIADFRQSLDISYFHEPRPGLVYARNAGIERFLATNAAWMGSIDDDEVMDDQWLIGMLDAMHTWPDCKVFAGQQVRVSLGNDRGWAQSKPKPELKTGTAKWDVTTGNVIFSRSVFAPNGLNLRYNPIFNFSGSEDTHLFYTLRKLNEDILWVNEAICFEPVHEARAAFFPRMKRQIQFAQSWGVAKKLIDGNFHGIIWLIFYTFVTGVNFITHTIIGAILFAFSQPLGVRIVNSGIHFGCRAIGYFKALFFKLGKLYEQVQGN